LNEKNENLKKHFSDFFVTNEKKNLKTDFRDKLKRLNYKPV